MVYDLGGGTFDVSIIEIGDDTLYIQTSDLTGILGCLTLCIVEICRNSDNCFAYGLDNEKEQKIIQLVIALSKSSQLLQKVQSIWI